MNVNGEAIYGTRMYTTFNEGEKIRFTQSKDGKTKFIFLFDFPKEKVNISKMPFAKNTKVELLGSKQKIKWNQKIIRFYAT